MKRPLLFLILPIFLLPCTANADANAKEELHYNCFTGSFSLGKKKIGRDELASLMQQHERIYPHYRSARRWEIIANTAAITSLVCFITGLGLSRNTELGFAPYIGMSGFGIFIATLPIGIGSIVKYKRVTQRYNDALDPPKEVVGFSNRY